MKKELQEKIFQRFDHLYRERGLSMQESCMYWGLDVGDGWFNILWELSEKIDRLLENHPKRGDFAVNQVKEKFGGLRYYVSCPEDKFEEIQKLISEAEERSFKTCDMCGGEGEIGGKGWITVKCRTCRDRKANP